MLHDSQNSFVIVNDEFACLKLSVALSVVQTSKLNCYDKNSPVFTFVDRIWVGVHILSHLAAGKENMILKMTICCSLSGSPLSNAILVKSGQ